MTLLARLAWRNLWRRKRRTALMLSAIALGVWSMVFLAALSRGWTADQLETAFKNLTGHAQLHARGWRDDPSVERRMPPPSGALLEALRSPGVRAWAARVRVPAVAASERESAAVALVGIDPAAERGLSFAGEPPAEGRALGSPADDGLVIGRKLAERLETRLGRRIVLLTQGADGRVADRGFRIVGVFSAQPETIETSFVFTGRGAAQRLLGIGAELSEIALAAEDRAGLGPVVERLREAAPALDAAPWTELEPLLRLTESLMDVVLWIWYVIVFAAMSFGLVNTLLMAVHERTREIGLLQALGMPPSRILTQILLESLVLLSLGALLGDLLAWATLAALSDGVDLSAVAQGLAMVGAAPVLRPSASLRDVWAANLVVGVLGLLASLYPAWQAARRVPVEAITRAA